MREAFVSLQSLQPVSKTRQVSPRAFERPLSRVSLLDYYSPSTSTTTNTLTTTSTTTTTTLGPSSLSITNDLDSVLSNTDIGVGIILAFLLAALAFYLRNVSHGKMILLSGGPPPPRQEEVHEDDGPSLSTVNATNTTFDEWKEMSRPDNYVWYKTRLRQKNNDNSNKTNKQANTTNTSTTFATEQTWVLIALVVFFAPIFSFEFFLTLSRQVACAFFNDLCLPYLDNNIGV